LRGGEEGRGRGVMGENKGVMGEANRECITTAGDLSTVIYKVNKYSIFNLSLELFLIPL
jgi:hypothetical protein